VEKIFNIKSDNNNKAIEDYRKRLARETGNPDFLKIHFHTLSHFAIPWHYFKTKVLWKLKDSQDILISGICDVFKNPKQTELRGKAAW